MASDRACAHARHSPWCSAAPQLPSLCEEQLWTHRHVGTAGEGRVSSALAQRDRGGARSGAGQSVGMQKADRQSGQPATRAFSDPCLSTPPTIAQVQLTPQLARSPLRKTFSRKSHRPRACASSCFAFPSLCLSHVTMLTSHCIHQSEQALATQQQIPCKPAAGLSRTSINRSFFLSRKKGLPSDQSMCPAPVMTMTEGFRLRSALFPPLACFSTRLELILNGPAPRQFSGRRARELTLDVSGSFTGTQTQIAWIGAADANQALVRASNATRPPMSI